MQYVITSQAGAIIGGPYTMDVACQLAAQYDYVVHIVRVCDGVVVRFHTPGSMGAARKVAEGRNKRLRKAEAERCRVWDLCLP